MRSSDSLREEIAAALRRAGRTQIDLAAASGLAQPRISEFLAGKRDLRLGQAAALLAAAGCELAVRRRRR